MLNYYVIKQTTYHDGKRVRSHCWSRLTEQEPHDSVVQITWENLATEFPKFGPCGFNVWHRKKGRVLEFFPDSSCWSYSVKEWKEPNLNIRIETTYTLTTPSIRTILDWGNGEAAMKYLLERGMNVITAAG